MNRIYLENLSKLVEPFENLLKAALLISIFVLLALYIFAIPLGLELFFFEDLSTTHSPSSSISATFFYVHIEVSLGFVFTSSLLVYILCFILAWKQKNSFHKVINRFFSKPVSLKNSLFALPILSTMTYVVVIGIHFFQESYGIPVGKPPLPKDPLLTFFELSISPLTEEISYRIFPIGVFLIVYLLTLGRKRTSLMLWKERLKISFLALISPEDAKKMLGLKTVDDSGFLGGVSRDEWVMILFTSAFFAFSHYFFTSTWNVGKISSTFFQGLVMGLSYLIYGIQAPILLHWFFNYYFYTYSLAATIHPHLRVLNFLNEKLTLGLGISGLLLIISLGVRELGKTRVFTLKTLLDFAEKAKNDLIEKSNKLLIRLRLLSFLDLATLLLTITILAVRLTIVNYPKPEVGERYYETGFVFDESYYVKAARKLLIGEASNNEHPPLLKILMVLGIILFGDNPLGWRIFPIISSSISIALIYGFTLILGKNKSVSFCAALLFATDIMAFNIGQIGMLDAPSMMFLLVGSTMLLKKRCDLGGLFFGFAFLCKLSSIFAALGMIFFLILARSIEHKRISAKFLIQQAPLIGRVILIGFITFLIGLWIYDAGYKAFNNNPLEHLKYMYVYHDGLKYQNPEDVILPLQWINPLDPFSPIAYHITTVREISNSGIVHVYHPIAYYGIYTPLWWSIWMVVLMSFIETLRKIYETEERRIGLFVFSWIATNFFPYVLLAYAMQRWVYPFYFYLTLPGLYIGLSHYLAYSRLSKIFLALLTFTQLLWFFVWFPVKPKIIIDLLLLLGLPA